MAIIGTWKSVLVTKWLYCRGFQIRKWLGEFITDGKSKVSDGVAKRWIVGRLCDVRSTTLIVEFILTELVFIRELNC